MIKDFYKKTKTFLKSKRKKFITFAATNRLFMSFIILATISTSFLRLFTMEVSSWSLLTSFFDLAVITLIASLGYLFKPRKQYIYFQTMLSIITIICLINAIYYSWYNSYVTVGLIESLGQVNTVTDAVFDKLKLIQFVYILFPIIFAFIYKRLKKGEYFQYVEKIEKSKKNFGTTMLVGIIFLCINILTLSGTDISRLIKQWNREYIVERYGIIVYQVNDIVQSIQSKLSATFGYDEAASEFIEYYSNKDTENIKNKYTNIYNGKNLVFVHMESMMSMFVDLKINDQEVTPNLNKLVKEGMYFSNFYPQISVGTSSDTEFTLNTSLMPALSGTVFVSYYDRNYTSIEKLLAEKGYYTFSMHANSSTMWNRKAMHESLGYDTFYSKEYFNVNEENTVGLGLSDPEFFKQMIPYLQTIEKDNKNYMGTIITLSNHTPWADTDKYGEFNLSVEVERTNQETGKTEKVIDSYLEGTKLGDYIKSAHYADAALGQFINYLYEYNLFNNTVLVFYGDHDAKLASKEYNYLYNYDLSQGRLLEEGEEGYIEYDYYSNELNRKTPLIIWNKNKKISKQIDYYMGMIDVMPTIGNMIGFSNPFALGNDIFNVKDNNMIVFPNGNFLTSSIYYNNTKGEYKVLKDSAIIDETYIEENKEKAEKILEISNDIIVYDLIEKEGNNILKEEE